MQDEVVQQGYEMGRLDSRGGFNEHSSFLSHTILGHCDLERHERLA